MALDLPTLDLLSRIASGIRSPPCRPPPSPCLLMANAAPRQNAADAWLSVGFRLRRRSRLAVARARNHRPAKRRVTPRSRRRRRCRSRASPRHGACARPPRAETSPLTIPPSSSRRRRHHRHCRPPPFPLLLSMARRTATAPTSSPLPAANPPTLHAPPSIVGANVDCHIYCAVANTPHRSLNPTAMLPTDCEDGGRR